MIYWIASAPVTSLRRTLAAVANGCAGTTLSSVLLSTSLAVASSSYAFAQEQPAPAAAAPTEKTTPPKHKPAKKAAKPGRTEAQQQRAESPSPAKPPPGQPQAQPGQPQPGHPGQQAQGGGQPQVQLIFSPWTKFCLKGQPGRPPDPNAKQVCFTGKDARIESGMPVVAAVLIEPEGMDRKILRVTLPLGMQLVHGTRVIIDQNQPMTAPYVICFTNGCMADYEANADMVAKLKKGQQLAVQAINSTGQPISLALPLADFAKAYDGPPTDPKVFEAQQRKLQEELQRRADEARKKLESEKLAPTSSAAPTPPNGKAQ